MKINFKELSRTEQYYVLLDDDYSNVITMTVRFFEDSDPEFDFFDASGNSLAENEKTEAVKNKYLEIFNRQYFQVVNGQGKPASNETGDLCIFDCREKANDYIDYLDFECGMERGTFKVVPTDLRWQI